MIDPALTKNLLPDGNGLWRSPKLSVASYPSDAHKGIFGVEDSSFWFQHRNDCILSVLEKFPPNEYIIDVGGGNGYVSQYIQMAGFKVIMLESGIEGIKNAQKRSINYIFYSSFEDARFPEKSVDSLGMFDVLEHIEKDSDFLRMARKCMKEKGRLYITVPAHKILWSWTDVRAGHFRRYSIKSLTQLLHETGFEVKFISYFFAWLSLPIFLFRTLPTRLRLTANKTSKPALKPHLEKKGVFSKFLKWHLEKETRRLKRARISHGSSIICVSESAR
jgi:SAM-dependent methyltransferase